MVRHHPTRSLLVAFFVLPCATPLHAVDPAFDGLKITEVVNQVSILDQSSRRSKPARQSEFFQASSLLSTGPVSRAELVSSDGTIARVGANTLFTISPEKREVSLDRGSILFNSPKGRGGGVIKSPGASAAVIGTSIVVTATQNGGFKLLVLEGKAQATLPSGATSLLSAGQMTFILPGGKTFGPLISFRLKDQVGGSALIKGFKSTLPSIDKITASIASQEHKIAAGKASATETMIADTKAFAQTDSNASLQQIRTSEAKRSPAPPTPPPSTPSTLAQALASDISVSSGILAPNRIFKFSNSAIPSEALTLLGADATKSITGYPEGSHAFFAGKNINVLGDRGSSSLGSFAQADGHVFLAKENFTINEGLPASDSRIVNARQGMGSLLKLPPLPDEGIWVSAGKSIRIQNSLLRGNIPYLTLGNWYSNYPDIPVEITDSAILGAMRSTATFGASSFTSYTDFFAGGASVKVADSSIIVTGNIGINGGQIDVTNGSPAAREFAAGYTANYNTAPQPGSRINLNARGDLNITKTNLGAASINLDAKTINLSGVDFKKGADVVLTSGLQGLAPNPNTNSPSVPRKVNFIRDVTYGGSPAQYFVDSNLGGSAASADQVKIKLRANGR
jgi:hypothetical protein